MSAECVAILALAMPYFWLAILVVVLPAIYWRWTPLWTYVPLSADPLENLKIMIFPALVFGVSRAGPIMRIMRSAMLEVQRQDYIRTAWAKGLPERSVIFKHAIKNALIPVVSIIGLQIHFYLGGIGDHRVHLPAAGHGEFLLRGADSPGLSGGAERQSDRGHLRAPAESHRGLQLRLSRSPHPLSLAEAYR